MPTLVEIAALVKAFEGAKAANHIFPAYAACEVMEESAWGTTEAFLQANNGFGEKQTHPPMYSTVLLKTWEEVHGQHQTIMAAFILFPTIADCFVFRMTTLTRLQMEYPHYRAALHASTGEEFITEVSKSWSTDLNRARNVLAIYEAHKGILV